MPTTIRQLIFEHYGTTVDELCKLFKVEKEELLVSYVNGQLKFFHNQFFSFITLLKKHIRLVKPTRILEWGPGQSTNFMLRECPDAEIICIESDQRWFNKYNKEFGHKVSLFHYPDWDIYTNPPVEGPFEIIFVDGHKRVRCMQTAVKLLSKDGVLVLHDGHREEYKPGIALFDTIEESHQTICLKQKS